MQTMKMTEKFLWAAALAILVTLIFGSLPGGVDSAARAAAVGVAQ
jgi:hypothetical protein